MTEHEVQVEASESMAVMLDISTGTIKVCNNIRNIPFEELSRKDWEAVQEVSHGFEALAEFTIDTIKTGALLMTDADIMEQVIAKLDTQQ